MEDTDRKLLHLIKNLILNDIHIIPENEEAFSRFRKRQLKAIDKYCRIWCESHGYENVPFEDLPFDEKLRSLLFARDSMGKDDSWRKE